MFADSLLYGDNILFSHPVLIQFHFKLLCGLYIKDGVWKAIPVVNTSSDVKASASDLLVDMGLEIPCDQNRLKSHV